MSVVMGSRYLENLMRVGGLVRDFVSGRDQNGTEVVFVSIGGRRCYYDRCFNKDMRTDSRIMIIDKRGDNAEGYAFHSACVDSLVRDKRINSLN